MLGSGSLIEQLRTIKLVLICSLIFSSTLLAQHRCFTFSNEQGLISNLTKYVLKDKEGFVWVATDAGLIKYDGSRFIGYTDSIPSLFVKQIVQNSYGELIVVTDLGIGKVETIGDNITYRPILSGSTTPNEKTLMYPKEVFESSEQVLWISEPGAVVRYGTRAGSSELFKRYSFDQIYQTDSYTRSFSFAETKDNELLCAAWKGSFFLYEAISDKFQLLNIIDSTGSSDNDLSSGRFFINQLQYHSRYGLLAATSHGLYTVRLSKDRRSVIIKRAFSIEGVSCFTITPSDEIYLGTWQKGVFVAASLRDKPEPLGIMPFEVVHCISKDAVDGIWVATDEGIALIQNTFFKNLPFRGKNSFMMGLHAARDGSLIVQDQENSYLIYPVSEESNPLPDTNFKSFPIIADVDSYRVRSIPKHPQYILFGSAGSLSDQWLSYREGIVEHVVNGQTYQIELPQSPEEVHSRRIVSLIVDREKALWGACEGLERVMRIDARHRIYEYGRSRGIISQPNVLRETKQGYLYVGANGNDAYLFRYDLYSDRFINISSPLPFKSKVPISVNDLAIASDGTIWIGSNLGLLRYKDGYVEDIVLAGLVTQPFIKSLYLDDEKNALWIGTEKGVYVYSNEEITGFFKQEGLPSATIIYRGIISSSKKRIWVGTSNGLAVFQYPHDSLPVTPVPRLSSILINRSDDRLIEKDAVFPNGAYLEIRYGPKIYPSERAQFQYQIPGISGWSIPSGEMNTVLPLLPPGDYLFQLRAQQAGYHWSPVVEFPFTVQQPWFQRWWMYVAYLSVFALTFFFIRKYNATLKDRRRFEEEQRKLVSLIEYSSECIVMISPKEELLFINTAGQILLGIDSQEEMKDKKMSDFIYEKDLMLYQRMILPTALMSGQWSGELRFRHLKTGLEMPVQFNSFSIRDERNEEVVAIASISSDITLRKQIEQALIDAREEALKAAQMKAEFLANMSHEIRTPMNAVIGMTGLLLETPLNHEQREYVETIRTSGDALLTIINDILDFSKIESGKLQLENYPFNLRSVVEEVLELFAVKAAEKNLDIAYLFHDNTPTRIMSDATRIRQILVNLVGNAVKFTPSGEVVIEVSVHETGIIEESNEQENFVLDENGELLLNVAEGSSVLEELPSREELEKLKNELPLSVKKRPKMRLLFKVRDTGIGISRDGIGRLFQSFSQVDSSTTRKYGGTGLGLAISKRLSEMMGGTMWVESVVGQGSVFYFTILTEDLPNVSEDVKLPKVSLEGKRLLVVDDNATNRRILHLQARSVGMTTIEVSSGEEALALIRNGEKFDIAILDYLMPEMDGVSLALEIRRYFTPQQLPIVMLTSIGRREENAIANSVSFAAYIYKPIKQAQLFEILENINRKAGSEDQATVLSPQQLDGNLAQRVPLRILLAEDNAVNQKLALKLLEKMGYRADVAGNGLEAIAALKRQNYDVILMDVQMPEMDGLAATRHIRKHWNDYERPSIIAMTANAMQGDREMCLDAGMDDYLSKPIRVAELQTALEHWGKWRLETQIKLQVTT